MFEKNLLLRLKLLLQERDTIPDHQFGLREKHSTLEQIHRDFELCENVEHLQ